MSKEEKPQNPPAFPRANGSVGGMRLRDYFAAQALAGDMAEESFRNDVADEVLAKRTALYYRIADAMLKARGEEDAPRTTVSAFNI